MTSDQATRHCLELVRDRDRDLYLAVLLLPSRARAAGLGLAALAVELDSIAGRVTEPMAGTIRLQWWRDGIARIFGNEIVEGTQVFATRIDDSPVLIALDAAVRRHDLSEPYLVAMIDETGGALLSLFQEAISEAEPSAPALAAAGHVGTAWHLSKTEPAASGEREAIAAYYERARICLEEARQLRARLTWPERRGLVLSVAVEAALGRAEKAGHAVRAPSPIIRMATAAWTGRY